MMTAFRSMWSSGRAVWASGWAAGCLAAVAMVSASVFGAGLAEAAAQKADKDKSAELYKSRSLFGSYLAARHAQIKRDTVSAARFLDQAMELEPDNPALVRQAFLVSVTNGDWGKAEKLAKRVLATATLSKDTVHRTAKIFLGVLDAQNGRWGAASDHFRSVGSGPNSELTATLSLAWVLQAQGETDEALALLDSPRNASWARVYFIYHKALIAVQAKRTKLAQAYFKQLFDANTRFNRAALAYGRFLASQKRYKTARKFLRGQRGRNNELHPDVKDLLKNLKAKETAKPLIRTAKQGLAEVYHSLGWEATLDRRVDPGLIYLKFSLMLWPELPIANWRLAYVYEVTGKHDLAVEAYRRIPASYVNSVSAGIQIARNLQHLKRWDEARASLEKLISEHPDDILPISELGRLMRVRKNEAEAVTYFSKTIKMIKTPKKEHWTHYYQRAQAYDQLGKWPEAEADLKMANRLHPDQPQVLNYLGYSWVDRNLNLKKAMKLIRKAVKLRPTDGYIVDSLGWAYYKLGNFPKAVVHLEKAVELAPQDPVLNDHLGDAYWRVGRQREARYQWEQSLNLKPKAKDAAVTKRKLVEGLPVLEQLKKRPVVRKRPPKKEKRASVERRGQQQRQQGFDPFTIRQ